jgi:hypothetical protein
MAAGGIHAMGSKIRFEGGVSIGTPKASALRPLGLARELAEQMEIFADDSSEPMYSDLYDHLRSGLRNVRRLLPTLTAHAPD